MIATRRTGSGALVSVATGGVLYDVGCTLTITPPASERQDIDVTGQTDRYRQAEAGIELPSRFRFVEVWDGYSVLDELFASDDSAIWSVTFGDMEMRFTGYVSRLEPTGSSARDAVLRSVTVTRTGPVTYHDAAAAILDTFGGWSFAASTF